MATYFLHTYHHIIREIKFLNPENQWSTNTQTKLSTMKYHRFNRRLTWQYVHSNGNMHLFLEELPPKSKIQIMTGQEIKSVYRHGGYLDKLELSQDLQTKFSNFNLQ